MLYNFVSLLFFSLCFKQVLVLLLLLLIFFLSFFLSFYLSFFRYSKKKPATCYMFLNYLILYISLDLNHHIYVHLLYLCIIIFLVTLYGQGSYRQYLLPNPYYICLIHNKNMLELKALSN